MSDIIERAETYMSYEHPRVGANRLVPQEIVKELVAELKALREFVDDQQVVVPSSYFDRARRATTPRTKKHVCTQMYCD